MAQDEAMKEMSSEVHDYDSGSEGSEEEIEDDALATDMSEDDTLFANACEEGDITTVKHMCDACPTFLSDCKQCALYKHFDKSRTDLVTYTNEGNGMHSLIRAARNGHIEVVKLLVYNGADINLCTLHERMTAFTWYVSHHDPN